jgi:hypothetical protein
MPAVRQHLAATPTWHRPGTNSSYNAAVVAAAAAAIAEGSSGIAAPDQQQQQQQQQQSQEQELAAAGAFTLPHWLWLGDPSAAFPQWRTVAAQRPAVLTAAQQRALQQGAGAGLMRDAVDAPAGAAAAADADAAGRGQLRRRQQRTQLRQPQQQQQLPPAHSGNRTASTFGECNTLVY